jgi:methylthioxylose transferase
MEASTGELRMGLGIGRLGQALPAAGAAVAGATVAFGLVALAAGVDLGTPLPPFLAHPDPAAGVLAPPAAAILATAGWLAPRLRSPRLSPLAFAAATLALALVVRLAMGVARDGVGGLYAVYELGHHEAASEYLPALPAVDLGVRLFLDTFAEVGPSLPVNAVGHPPGLLLALHWLGIDGARGMAALTIGGGALSLPLGYALARRLLDERRARVATLLYAFAPSAVLFGATSADALYATLALAAALPLVARGPRRHLGPPLLAVASFFSYANLAVGAWAVVVAAGRDGLRRAATLAIACAIGIVAFYLLLHAVSGYDPVGALRAANGVYREGVASGRPYAFWLFGAPVAFLVALGPPIAWFALRAAGEGWAPAVALLAVLAIAALLGFTKAETERIYLFLVPLACIAAAATLPDRLLPPALAFLAAQALAGELLLDTVW